MKTITLQAPGKINLGLNVVGKREDGYHELYTVMQTLQLHDVLTLTVGEEGPVTIGCGHEQVPADPTNLAVRAAELMRWEYGIKNSVHIELTKNIPVAAGMGGGSADCAAVLRGMNELFGLHVDTETLCKLGKTLGADVPFCVVGGTCLAEGIGEILTPLPTPPACTVLIAKPNINISTPWAYKTLDTKENLPHPDGKTVRRAIEEQDFDLLCESLGNSFEYVCGEEYPIIKDIEKVMLESDASASDMSGSGPTVFGLFKERKDAEKAAERIKQEGLATEVHVTAWS